MEMVGRGRRYLIKRVVNQAGGIEILGMRIFNLVIQMKGIAKLHTVRRSRRRKSTI